MIPESELSNDDLLKYLMNKYEKRKISVGRLYNNVTQENQQLSQEQFINMYLNNNAIYSGYSCLFEDQDHKTNLSAKALENLGDMRKFNKKKMEAAEHGSNDYVYYRILQLTYKVLMNSYYGILGEKNSIFYNAFIQNSITKTGQQLITTSIIAMENFLSNNVLFEDMEDFITFITNVATEDRKFNILDFVDRPILHFELVDYLKEHFKPYSEVNFELIEEYVNNLSPELTTRAFYKNQFIKLMENQFFQKKMKEMLKYKYENEPAPEMVNDLEEVKALILDFVFYDFLYEDRYKRAMKDTRKSIITIDTDSNFINADCIMQNINRILSLDSNNSEQQGTLFNIIINITTGALKDLFWTLTMNKGVPDKAKPIISMKQEFGYKKLILTENKKNYVGLISSELGKQLPKPLLDIKGLPILKKTSVPKVLRKEFTKIVEDKFLKTEKINLSEIISEYDRIAAGIETSLREGKTEYLLPKNCEILEKYKEPSTIEAVRAVLVWNACEPEQQIIPPEKINLIKLNCVDENDPRLEDLKKNFSDKYEAIMKVVWNHNTSNVAVDISRFGLSCIAIPKDVEKIPEYIRPFIDYKDMENTNMQPSYILLQSLGVYVADVKTTTYKSNIIQI